MRRKIMLVPGTILRGDSDFDYAVHFKQDVEVWVGGVLDHCSPIIGYTADMVFMDECRYLKNGVVEFRVR